LGEFNPVDAAGFPFVLAAFLGIILEALDPFFPVSGLACPLFASDLPTDLGVCSAELLRLLDGGDPREDARSLDDIDDAPMGWTILPALGGGVFPLGIESSLPLAGLGDPSRFDDVRAFPKDFFRDLEVFGLAEPACGFIGSCALFLALPGRESE
jgi:hypothetical protein